MSQNGSSFSRTRENDLQRMKPTGTKDLLCSPTASINVTSGPMALVLPKIAGAHSVLAFSVRTGGCSPPPFESLNFSVSQGDVLENVQRNYKALAKRLGIEADGIVTCRQVHEDNVEIIDAIPRVPPRADAIITSTPGIYPAIKTADCLPILLLDPVRRVAGAIHAGWRGTVLRITRKVVRMMKTRFGTDPSDLIAGLGPAIGPCCYEVDEVVLKPFRENFPRAEQFIVRSNNSRDRSKESLRLDLAGANCFELIQEGVPSTNIYSADLCTSCNSSLFFSYRRDGMKSGRHIAVTGFIP
jgi:purine-nucleoside/S-methyl-5'-thioadenosine phosphorylase / adenosine deaminase